MATSPLASAIEFLEKFGLFDVVLPFLLIFTFVFAILEKTMILGKENDQPKRNLNSMVAFVIALLTIASNKIVNAITTALPNIVLLSVISLSFLMLVGVFAETGEFSLKEKHKGFYYTFVIFSFIGVILIFLASVKTSAGVSWLRIIFNYIKESWGGAVISSVILLIIVVGAIIFVTRAPKKEGGGE